MEIIINIPRDMEMQIRKNLSRGDAGAVRRLLLNVIESEVEALLKKNAAPNVFIDEFERRADLLAEEFMKYAEKKTPALSDYAVSREGIYEEH